MSNSGDRFRSLEPTFYSFQTKINLRLMNLKFKLHPPIPDLMFFQIWEVSVSTGAKLGRLIYYWGKARNVFCSQESVGAMFEVTLHVYVFVYLKIWWLKSRWRYNTENTSPCHQNNESFRVIRINCLPTYCNEQVFVTTKASERN